MKKLLAVILSTVLLVTGAMCLMACGGSSSKEQVKLVSIGLTEEEYAFAMKGDNTELQADFNAFLNEIKGNGTFAAIMAKYFEGEGEKVGYNYNGDGSGDGSGSGTQAGQFVVATNCPFAPFEYIDNGKIYGVDMEIAAAYAEAKGLTLVIKNIDFDAILPALDAGYADIGMAGMTVNEDRAAYLFTQTYYNASLNVIVAADCKDFDNCKTAADVEEVLSGLKNKKIGYQTGTTSVDYVAEYANVEGVGYDTAALATYDLVNGNLYAVIVDNAPAAAIVASYNK